MSVDVYRPVEEAEALGPTTECGILVICRPEAPFEINGDITKTLIAG